jgi:carbon storage regulator CsrA
MIGDDIEIVVIGVKSNKGDKLVRLAITAPDHGEIHRKEIWLERQEGVGVEFDPEQSVSDAEAKMKTGMDAARKHGTEAKGKEDGR